MGGELSHRGGEGSRGFSPGEIQSEDWGEGGKRWGGKFHSSEGGQKSFEKGEIFGWNFWGLFFVPQTPYPGIRFSADFGQENPALIRMACRG